MCVVIELSEIREWQLKKRVEKTLNSLREKGFEAIYAPNKAVGMEEILKLIPMEALVGVGGSITLREMGLIEALNRRGNNVAQHWQEDLSDEDGMIIRRQQLTSDVFLASSNAITERGELVNVDGAGNRVASMIFGPGRVVLVAGVNKIVADLESAISRVNNVSSPMNAKRLKRRTPCAETGVCSDCDSPHRICNVTTIMHRKPSRTRITIVLVGEELGY